MKWTNKFDHSGSEYQEDSVGNILQIGGAVVPIACQKCKKKFKSKVIQKEIKQDVPSYKCNECNFEGTTGDQAFDHTLEKPTHKIIKTKKSRIVGYNNTIEGRLSYVTKTENDVLILCGECNDG